MTVHGRRRPLGVVRALLAGLIAVAVVAGAGACTTGDDPRERRLAPLPTTTVDLGDAEGAELPPPLPGTPPEEIRAAGGGRGRRDTCALAAAIDEGIPDTDDRAAVLSAYRRPARRGAIGPFVPPRRAGRALGRWSTARPPG